MMMTMTSFQVSESKKSCFNHRQTHRKKIDLRHAHRKIMDLQYKDKMTQLVSDAVKSLKICLAPKEPSGIESEECPHDNNVMTWSNLVDIVIENHNAKCDHNQWYASDIQLIVTVAMPDSSHATIPIDLDEGDDREDGKKDGEVSIKHEAGSTEDEHDDEEDFSGGESMADEDEDKSNQIKEIQGTRVGDDHVIDTKSSSDRIKSDINQQTNQVATAEDEHNETTAESEVKTTAESEVKTTAESEVKTTAESEVKTETGPKYYPSKKIEGPPDVWDKETYPHQCQVCRRVFLRLSGLKAHMKFHEEPTEFFKCPLCPKVFRDQQYVNTHMRRHSKIKKHKCQDCEEAFRYADQLKTHRKKVHGVHVRKPPKCRACGALFKDTKVLKEHLWQKHHIGDGSDTDTSSEDAQNDEETDMLSCPHCSEKYKTEENLKTHVESHGPLNPHKCEICGWRFIRNNLLVLHFETHDAKKDSLQCDICQEKCNTAVELNEHIRKHTNTADIPDPKQCQICKKTFYRERTRKQHELRHSQPPEKHECHLCDKFFPHAHYLRAHMQAHKKENKCTVCEETFRFAAELIRHRRDVHQQAHKKENKCAVCEETFRLEAELIRHRRDVHQLIANYVCDVCGSTYTIKANLKEHMNSHTGEKTFLCALCGKTFIHRGVYKSHMKQHKDVANRGTVPCTQCPKLFQSQKRMRMHIRNFHLQEKRFHCQYCDKSYFQSSAHKAHEQTHTGNMDYKCPYCPKQFPTKRQFDFHERTHTGVKPFECSICKKQFSQKMVRDRHMKGVHITENKPRPQYTCETCGAILGSKTALKAHEKRHLGIKDHVCDDCGAAFMFKPDLMRHLKIHTDGKPYKCDQCPMRFARRADVSRHCLVHADITEDSVGIKT